jgi:hypothetical protein
MGKFNMKWIKIADEIPEEERLVLYFHDMTGTHLGFYFGIDDGYCSETGHIFGGNFGFLTGDVTHWAYTPDYPEGLEDHAESNAEYARVLGEKIGEMKKPIYG